MKTLIIDDEPKAVQNLEHLLRTYHPDFFSRIDAARDAEEALRLIETLHPDVLFLDIHLQDTTGFDLLNRTVFRDFKVVFVTAYDQYAIRAIRLNAFDYLLKPVDLDELDKCLTRLSGPKEQTVPIPFAEMKSSPDYILLKDAYNFEKIPFSGICYLEASGPYTNIVYLKEGKTARTTRSKPLHDFEELMPETDFIRIHRSYIVNLKKAGKLVREQDKYFIRIGSELLPVSRRRFAALADRLEGISI